MRSAVLAFAIFSSACIVIDAAVTETEHVSRTATLAPGGTLKLKNFSGRVTITGTDRPDASIDAVRRASRDRLDHIKLDIHTEGSTLVINANQRDRSAFRWARNNGVVDTDFTIEVPRRTSLDADVFSSPLTASGLEGSHNVHGFSSRIRLENAIGAIRVHTFSGSVDIRTASWQPDQALDVDTFSGNVDLHLPDSAGGTVDFNSFSGHLSSDIPLTFRSGNRRAIRAELGGRTSAEGASLRFKTFSGSVRINR